MESEKVICTACGHELEIGDYPFCPHGSIYEQNAQHFDPIVFHKDVTTGEYSVPMHASDPAPPGHMTVEIRNMREADRVVKEINSRSRSEASDRREMNRLYFEERRKETRERVDAEIQRRGITDRRVLGVLEKIRERQDAKHNRKFSSTKAFDPNTHIQVLSFNRGNRMPHAGPETGWRDKRV